MKLLLSLAAVTLGLIACGPAAPSGAARQAPTSSPTTSPTPAASAATFEAEDDGLRLVAELDRLEVPAGDVVTVELALHNGRPAAVPFEEPCQTNTMIVQVPVPVEPAGRDWDGIAGAFKTYALEHGTGSPIESSTRTPLSTVADTLPCHAPAGTIAAGDTYETTLRWTAELVRGLPAGPGDVPFSIQVLHDQEPAGNGLIQAQTIELRGTITVTGGNGEAVSAAEALDAALGEADFGAWLSAQPRDSWVNANLFLQPGAIGVDVLPEVPYWDVELFREPRNWAIVYVDATSGAVLRTDFCNDPCNR